MAIFLLIASASSTHAAWAQDEAAIKAAKEVLALEEIWLQSERSNKPELAAPLMAEEFYATGIDGRVINRAQDIATTPQKYVSAENFDMQTSVFANTVIVRGGHKSKGVDSTGRPFEIRYRFTDTWVKMPNGKWQCVASHSSPLKM